MTMHKKILYILSLMGLFSFAACTNEESPLLSEGTGEIRFSVVDTTEIEIATRASYYFDVNKFNVSLNRGSEPIFSDKKYGDLVGKTFTYSAGPDYVLTAESCTEAEAESANQGWGQARASGKESFAIVKDESKTVTVNCGVVNSSVSVKFSDYITSMFTTYSIELHATDATSRTFTFDKSNYTFKTAYFNVGESGRKVAYTVSLLSFKNPYTGTLTLEPSKSYNLSVKVEGEGTNTTVTLDITVDGTLLEEKILPEKINPYM